MIRAIIFDFGRVITAQKPPSLFSLYEKDLGLAPGSLNRIMFGSRAWQETLIGHMTANEFWSKIGPELGLKTPEEVDAFRLRYQADEAINEGVLELIRQLHGHVKLAVISNSPPGLARWLADWRILDLFDVVFCSGDEGVVKPDPTAFKVALDRLGVKPDETVFIDDTREHVEAALTLGLHGIVYKTAEALADEIKEFLRAS